MARKKKSIFKSKTFWVNILMAAAVILPEVANMESFKVNPEITALVILVVNVILRAITTDGVALKS